MFFPVQLQSAILIKRYKRFLADVKLPDNKIITIHCANTGAMTGCANEGDTIWYSTSDNPKRKLPYSWELTQTKQHWICVNTIKANQIVKEAILNQQIPTLAEYIQLQAEIKYGNEQSRIDFLATSAKQEECYIEVKSVTLCNTENQMGYFPDAVTTRGQKHLRELMLIRQQGKRAVLFFLILHTGIKSFSPASWIDPAYSQLLKQAIESGVEVLCYNTIITTEQIIIDQPIPLILSPE